MVRTANRCYAGQLFLIVLLLSGCDKGSTTPHQPEKTRAEYLWLNETIALAPGNDTTFFRALVANDTLHVTIGLLNQYAIGSLTIRNGADEILLQKEDVASESFNFHITTSDTHALVMQQTGELTLFQLHVKVIRWEYRP